MGDPVLVTGGAGFLGSHLVDRLLEQGDRVHAIDNFASGTVANVAHVMSHPRFRLQRHDIETPLNIVPAVRIIYHLAGCASPVRHQRDPVKAVTTSVIGTRNMLDLAQRTGARLLLASASEVYGDTAAHLQAGDLRGDVDAIGPRAGGAVGKRCAEALAFAYARTRGVSSCVARIGDTYGPRMDTGDGRAFGNLIVQALRGEPMTVFGDGTRTLGFCYVGDAVEGVIALAGGDHEGPIDLGHPAGVSMMELAETIRELAGSRSEIVLRPFPVDAPVHRCPPVGIAENVLGWRPHVPLRRGLELTIEHFRGVLRSRQPNAVSA